MKPYDLTSPPRRLRRPGVKPYNVALVPASLLPHKPLWQALANRLPTGSILIVSPLAKPGKVTIARVADRLEAHGHPVLTIPPTPFPRTDLPEKSSSL